ncbi:MAG: sulfate adenylyltransferase [Euryarchaeota archaeon]|nr:sulfate adenylyltransferase [Euryarchaeota archaeon]
MATASKPHGGALVERILPAARARKLLERDIPRVEPPLEVSLDAEKICIGAYSPLTGFQGAGAVASILRRMELPGGLPWSIPIVFPWREDYPEAGEVLLTHGGAPFAIFHVKERFRLDPGRVAQAVYGTRDPQHPNVADLLSYGNRYAAGPVELLRRLPAAYGDTELSPRETRREFQKRGWETVVGYQTRNPPHRAHEYLQRCALELVDGLLVHPVVGKLKEGDWPARAIVRGYQRMMDALYPRERVLLSTLSIAMRYAGPKAAVHLAIVRKNYGCTHFIVGRDIAGVGRYYGPYDAHRIFEGLDLGIIPLRFREAFHCRGCGTTATDRTCGHPPEQRVEFSGTQIRAWLRSGQPVPPEAMRPEVVEVLREEMASPGP